MGRETGDGRLVIVFENMTGVQVRSKRAGALGWVWGDSRPPSPVPRQLNSILISETILITASSTTFVSGCRTMTKPSPS